MLKIVRSILWIRLIAINESGITQFKATSKNNAIDSLFTKKNRAIERAGSDGNKIDYINTFDVNNTRSVNVKFVLSNILIYLKKSRTDFLSL